MKKNIGKILAMAIVAIMMMSTIAFADAAMGEPAVAENVVTVTLNGLTANEEATILVVKDGVTLDTVTDADIVYIDQLTVGEDGSVAFTLDASAAVPAEPTADVYVDIFCGYTNMADAAPLSGTAKIFTYVAPEEPADVVYGDVNGDTSADTTDATLVLQYYANTLTEFPADGGATAADVNGDTSVDTTDATLILQYYANTLEKFPAEK